MPRVIVDVCRHLRARGGGRGVAAACVGVGQGHGRGGRSLIKQAGSDAAGQARVGQDDAFVVDR